MTDDIDTRLEVLREEYIDARDALYALVVDACPGPHDSVQHRDRKPSWCRACGRDDQGRQQSSGDH